MKRNIVLSLIMFVAAGSRADERLLGGGNISDAAREALDNEFANDDFYGIGVRPLNEYMPVCAFDDVYIYRHKYPI